MMTGSEIGGGIKYLGIVKDLPLWVLTALALALDVFFLVPQFSADLDKG